jgi:hypothetical protein
MSFEWDSKSQDPCHSRYLHEKYPSRRKTHRTSFCISELFRGNTRYEWIVLDMDVRVNPQSRGPNESLIRTIIIWSFVYSLIYLAYTRFVCLSFFAILNNDGGQFLFVEEWTQIHYTMFLGIDHRLAESKLPNFLIQSHRYEQDSNRRGPEVRGLVVWERCINHSAAEVYHFVKRIFMYKIGKYQAS